MSTLADENSGSCVDYITIHERIQYQWPLRSTSVGWQTFAMSLVLFPRLFIIVLAVF